MSNLVEFLLARLAEDENHARLRMHHAQQNHLMLQEPNLLGRIIPGWHEWPEIEAWAARVLTEVEAKRQIVALHQPGEMLDHYEFGCTCGFSDHRWAQCKGCGAILDDEGELDRGIRNRACPTLRLLALPYADHPHYRDEWRP